MFFRQPKKSIKGFFLAITAASLFLGMEMAPESHSAMAKPGRGLIQELPIVLESIVAAAVGQDGTVFIAFEDGGQKISELTPDGRFLNLAGSIEEGKTRFADEPGLKAGFDSIYGFVVDSKNRLNILDRSDNALLVLDASGRTMLFAGNPRLEGCRVDGFRGWARFDNPCCLAKGANGVLYLIDGNQGNGRKYFRKMTADGYVSTFTALPLGMIGDRGKGENVDLDWDCLVADSSDRIYVGATEQRILVRISPQGGLTECYVIPIPQEESSPSSWWFAADSQGHLYLAVSEFGIHRMNSKGTWEKLSGNPGREVLDEAETDENSESVASLTIDAHDRLILIKTDEGGSRMWIERLNPAAAVWQPEPLQTRTGKIKMPQWIWRDDEDDIEDDDLIPQNAAPLRRPMTLTSGLLTRKIPDADEFSQRLVEDPKVLAGFYSSISGAEGIDPMSWVWRAIGNVASSNIAMDSHDNVLLGDATSGAVIRISPQGQAKVLAAVPRKKDETDDRHIVTAYLRISVRPFGSIFVKDNEGDILFRELLPDGRWNIYPEEWIGEWSSSNEVDRLLFDSKGNVYLVPSPIYGRARTEDMPKVTSEGDFEFLPLRNEPPNPSAVPESIKPGVITMITCGGFSSLAFDGRNGFYAACPDEHVIRKRAPDGTLKVFAGRPLQPGRADGPSAEARFFFPFDVAADREGNVFVADTFNHTIRKIDPDGAVIILAGSAGSKGRLDGQGAGARFDTPSALALGQDGSLYVLDQKGSAIRKVTRAGQVTTLFSSESNNGWAQDSERPRKRRRTK